MIKLVQFWPRLAAENATFPPYVAVLSITDPKQALPVLKGGKEVLRLAFYDLTKPHAEDPRFGPETLFTEAQAQAVIEFVRRLHEAETACEVVVHCEGGVSRSAAVALYVQAATGCEIARRGTAGGANKHIVALLSRLGGVTIDVPELEKSAGGILLFAPEPAEKA